MTSNLHRTIDYSSIMQLFVQKQKQPHSHNPPIKPRDNLNAQQPRHTRRNSKQTTQHLNAQCGRRVSIRRRRRTSSRRTRRRARRSTRSPPRSRPRARSGRRPRRRSHSRTSLRSGKQRCAGGDADRRKRAIRVGRAVGTRGVGIRAAGGLGAEGGDGGVAGGRGGGGDGAVLEAVEGVGVGEGHGVFARADGQALGGREAAVVGVEAGGAVQGVGGQLAGDADDGGVDGLFVEAEEWDLDGCGLGEGERRQEEEGEGCHCYVLMFGDDG